MAINGYGAVQVSDFGQPKVISAYAREVISGGQFVAGSTAAGVVASGLDSFTADDMKVYVAGSGTVFTGIALANVESGALVPVALEGVFLLQSRGTFLGGNPISAAGDESVSVAVAGQHIGRALTGATSGLFAAVHIK